MARGEWKVKTCNNPGQLQKELNKILDPRPTVLLDPGDGETGWRFVIVYRKGPWDVEVEDVED